MVAKNKNYGAISPDPEILTSYSAPRIIFGVCRGSPLLVSFYIIVYVSYLMFGALVFSTTEAPGEMQIRHRIHELRHAFLTQYPCVQGNFYFGIYFSICLLLLFVIILRYIKLLLFLLQTLRQKILYEKSCMQAIEEFQQKKMQLVNLIGVSDNRYFLLVPWLQLQVNIFNL